MKIKNYLNEKNIVSVFYLHDSIAYSQEKKIHKEEGPVRYHVHFKENPKYFYLFIFIFLPDLKRIQNLKKKSKNGWKGRGKLNITKKTEGVQKSLKDHHVINKSPLKLMR